MSHSASRIGRIVNDIVDLCELQLQLLSVNSQESTRRARRAAVLLAAGVTLAGSALTTTMIGGGFLLHESADWSVSASLLTIAGLTFALVVVLLIVGAYALASASAALEETKSEFVENLKWIKAVLVSPETSPRNQLRAEDFPPPHPEPSHGRSRETNEPLFTRR